MKRLIALVLLWASSIFADRVNLSPIDGHEFPMSYSQWGGVFSLTPEDIVWINGDRIRSKHPFFKDSSDAELKAYFASQQPVGHLSRLQFGWDQILMERTGESPQTAFRFSHPQNYIRGNFFNVMLPSAEGQSGSERAMSLDGKGGGLSPEGEGYFRLFQVPIQAVLGQLPHPESDPRLQWLETRLAQRADYLEAVRRDLLESLESMQVNAPERDSFERTLEFIVLRPLRLTRLLLQLLPRVRTGGIIHSHERNEVLELARDLDYANGLLPLERGLKEVMTGIALEELLKDYNAKHGTHFGVIEPLMLVRLPVNILLPNGIKQRAGILYRESHWRAGALLQSNFEKRFPSELATPSIKGALQFDVFGNLVDLEMVDIPLLAAKQYSIDRESRIAATLYQHGHLDSIQKMESDLRFRAKKIVIPDSPCHQNRPEEELVLEAAFQKLIRDLERPTADWNYDKLHRDVQAILWGPTPLPVEQKQILFMLMVRRSENFAVNAILEEADHVREEEAKGRKNDRSYLLSAIFLVLKKGATHFDRPCRRLQKNLSRKHFGLYSASLENAAELYRELLSVFDEPIEEFYPQSHYYENFHYLFRSIVNAHRFTKGKNLEQARAIWDQTEFEGNEGVLTLAQMVALFQPSPTAYWALLYVAQIYLGEELSAEFLNYLDPNNAAKVPTLAKRLSKHVKAGISTGCSGNLVQWGG